MEKLERLVSNLAARSSHSRIPEKVLIRARLQAAPSGTLAGGQRRTLGMASLSCELLHRSLQILLPDWAPNWSRLVHRPTSGFSVCAAQESRTHACVPMSARSARVCVRACMCVGKGGGAGTTGFCGKVEPSLPTQITPLSRIFKLQRTFRCGGYTTVTAVSNLYSVLAVSYFTKNKRMETRHKGTRKRYSTQFRRIK